MNNNNQVDEELAHAHFEYAGKKKQNKTKHEKTSYEFRVGSLLVNYSTIVIAADRQRSYS